MVTDAQIKQAKSRDILTLVPTGLKRVSGHDGGEYAGPCPFCHDGNDRFRVWPKTGRYWCRVCGAKGDAIDLICQLNNLSFTDAVETLANGHPKIDQQFVDPKSKAEPIHITWERRARDFVTYCMDHLQPDGIAYLQTRGLDEITGFGSGIGWNPEAINDKGSRWGIDEDVYLAAGLVIPYEYQGRITAINIRTTESYRIVKGSKLNRDGNRIIYRPCPWPIKEKVILFEGEFDALAAWQSLGGMVQIGCGSIPAGNLTSLDELDGRECYVCFDNDAAGMSATMKAVNLGAKAIHLPKEYKDFNQFLVAVGDAAAGAFLLEAIHDRK